MRSEPHNSTRPAGAPSRAISNIPVKHDGHLVGYAELKDGIITVELMDDLTAQYIKEGLMMGLVKGLSLGTLNVPAFPHPNQTEMEI